MFRATVSPIFRSTLTVYIAFWNNVPTLLFADLLPTGDTDWMERQVRNFFKLVLETCPVMAPVNRNT